MSVGFGFSLPALAQYGGGGNNPFGQLGPTLDLSFAGTVTDTNDPNGYTLNTNFITPQYQVAADYTIWETNVGLVSKNFSDIITFTRASTATYFDSAGVLQSAAINTPRFDYDPSTLAAQGLLIEEQRTNSIRNNTMVGAVAGTPGTLPTNWSVNTGGLTGITQQIVGTGTESGITYLDIRFSGTPSAVGTYRVITETTLGIPALTGQTWSNSQYLKLAAGTLTGVTGFTDVYQEFTSAGAFVTEAGVVISSPTTAGLATQRSATSRTLAGGATTAFVRTAIQLSLSVAAIDITLRIGLPQLELGAFATSVIPTDNTAPLGKTRSADVASVNTLSPWYNASAGTLYAEAQTFSTSGTAVLASIDDTTAANRIQLRRSFTSNGSGYRMVSSGGSFDVIQISGTLAGVNKLSIAATAGAQTASTNGSTVTGIVSITPMPTVTRLALGDGPGSTSLNGWLRRVTFYPRVLSQSEQNAITA